MQQLDDIMRQAMVRVLPLDSGPDRTAISELLGNPPPPRPHVGNPFPGGTQVTF